MFLFTLLAILIACAGGQSFDPKCGPAVISTGTSEIQISYSMGLVASENAIEFQLTFREWGAVGIRAAGTTGMTDLDIAAVSSVMPDNVTDCYATTFSEPEVDTLNDLTYVSHSISSGFITTRFYRLLSTTDSDDYNIPQTGTVNIAWATGTGDLLTWSKHTLKGSLDITLLPLDCTTAVLNLGIDTGNPGYSYLRNTFSWDGVCQVGLTCKTIFLRLENSVRPPANSNYQCKVDIPTTEGSYGVLNRFVPLNADGTCVFTELQISGIAKQITLEFSVINVVTSALVSTNALSVRLMLRSPLSTMALKKVMKVVVGSGDTQFSDVEFISILSNRLSVRGSLIHVLGARPFTVSERRASPQVLDCQGGSSEITWLLDDSVPSASADTTYSTFLKAVTVPSSAFSTELCGVTEAYADWRAVDPSTPNLDQRIVFDASPLRYSYLRVSPWRNVCFNKRVCKTIILKFSDAATTAHYLRLGEAQYPTMTVTTADTDTTVVGGTVTMSSAGLFIFNSLTLLGIGDSTETVRFTLGNGDSTITVSAELENIDESIIPILAYQMVFRQPVSVFNDQSTFQQLVGAIVNSTGISEAIINMGVAPRTLSTSRSPAILQNSNLSYCGVETGTGTEWRWAVNCTTCDQDAYYSSLTQMLADRNGELSKTLCGVDEITKIWVEIIETNTSTPVPPKSDDEDNTPWWILLCLAFSLCCCGLAMFGYGLHKRKHAKERSERSSDKELVPIGGMYVFIFCLFFFKTLFFSLLIFKQKTTNSIPAMPVNQNQQQFIPMRDSTVEEPPAIQTAEDANDEIVKLQREIDMLENQKGVMDKLTADAPPDVEASPPPGQVGATPSKLMPFTAERIGPNGPVPIPQETDSDIEIQIDPRATSGTGGAPAQA